MPVIAESHKRTSEKVNDTSSSSSTKNLQHQHSSKRQHVPVGIPNLADKIKIPCKASSRTSGVLKTLGFTGGASVVAIAYFAYVKDGEHYGAYNRFFDEHVRKGLIHDEDDLAETNNFAEEYDIHYRFPIRDPKTGLPKPQSQNNTKKYFLESYVRIFGSADENTVTTRKEWIQKMINEINKEIQDPNGLFNKPTKFEYCGDLTKASTQQNKGSNHVNHYLTDIDTAKILHDILMANEDIDVRTILQSEQMIEFFEDPSDARPVFLKTCGLLDYISD